MKRIIKNVAKPFSTKVLIGLVAAKVTIYLMAIIAFVFLKDLGPAKEGLLAGIRDGIVESFELDANDMNYALGNLIGKLSLTIIFHLLLLYSIRLRIFKLAVGMIIFIFISELINGIPLYTFMCALIIFYKPTRNFLKKKQTEELSSEYILDEELLQN